MDESQNPQDTVDGGDHKENSEDTVVDTGATEAETGDRQQDEQESGEPSSTDEAATNDVASLMATVELLNEQLAAAKDDQLRVQAEMQNLRRRAERDVENAHKFGLEKLINGLLPVLDNFDRAITAVPADAVADNESLKGLLEGVELTRKSAIDVLTRFSVEVLEPFGEPFDPQFHEAMTMVPSATAEPNSVVDVLQKGYRLNGRLLRAAMVVIAKPADEDAG